MNPAPPSSQVNPNFKWVFQTAGRTIAFGFGSGLSPIAPGTAGTLWAWAAFLVGEYFLSTEDFLWIIGGGILLGCWVCGHVSEELGRKDFGGIVWDEIVAFWLVLIFIMPTNIWMDIGKVYNIPNHWATQKTCFVFRLLQMKRIWKCKP
jgi:phosphatidylglycerophosphatase A